MKIPWASLLLIAVVFASNIYFAQPEPYASPALLASFGLAWWNPLGVFTHLFMHQGVRHLLANILPLVTFAVLLETQMSTGGVLVIFFASGIAGGLAYILVNPGAVVIGASAASSGLMAAATALRPKQAILLAVFITVLAVLFVTPASDYFTSARKTDVQTNVRVLGQQQEQAQAQAHAAKSAVSDASARVADLEQQGRTAEANRVRSILVQRQAALAEAEKTAVEANESFAGALKKSQEFAQGEAQENAPVSALPHAVGAFVGLLFVFKFRKSDVDENLRRFKAWLAGLRGAKPESL
jgi:membrane associated rhomboid family serine protease